MFSFLTRHRFTRNDIGYELVDEKTTKNATGHDRVWKNHRLKAARWLYKWHMDHRSCNLKAETQNNPPLSRKKIIKIQFSNDDDEARWRNKQQVFISYDDNQPHILILLWVLIFIDVSLLFWWWYRATDGRYLHRWSFSHRRAIVVYIRWVCVATDEGSGLTIHRLIVERLNKKLKKKDPVYGKSLFF
jgi:hypothetical protein